jgi:hypothetical protein
MPLTRDTILVAAHDAGGAAVLASVVSAHQDAFNWVVAVAGPAVGILGTDTLHVQRRVFESDGSAELAQWMRAISPALVLTGTGWQTSFELDAIQAAKSFRIPNAAYLDHWVNFRERFGSPAEWESNLPDRILVGDKYAFDRAMADGFAPASLVQIENPFLKGLLVGTPPCHAAEAGAKREILFVSEPTQVSFPWQQPASTTRAWEFDAIELLARYVEGTAPRLKLKVRLHPSEHSDKYRILDEVFGRLGVLVSPASDKPLQEEIRESDAVFGIGSMALLAACAMGYPVATILPAGGTPILPHAGIANCYSIHDITAFVDALSGRSRTPNMALYETKANVVLNRLMHTSEKNETGSQHLRFE